MFKKTTVFFVSIFLIYNPAWAHLDGTTTVLENDESYESQASFTLPANFGDTASVKATNAAQNLKLVLEEIKKTGESHKQAEILKNPEAMGAFLMQYSRNNEIEPRDLLAAMIQEKMVTKESIENALNHGGEQVATTGVDLVLGAIVLAIGAGVVWMVGSLSKSNPPRDHLGKPIPQKIHRSGPENGRVYQRELEYYQRQKE